MLGCSFFGCSLGCFFCENHKNPSYKDDETLKKFLSKGKLQSIKKTDCCAKHQMMLAREISRAKEIALLP